ncbi:hypothetical protein C1X61_09290 [Pseudomonas sp. FW215-T2]|nr:hypothetical protein C1X61_09290 [Pseudomonas sp. FW215-T2]PNB35099.1 hypothetical protein C1X63_24135 [Pseudomonas sp. FW305-131]
MSVLIWINYPPCKKSLKDYSSIFRSLINMKFYSMYLNCTKIVKALNNSLVVLVFRPILLTL